MRGSRSKDSRGQAEREATVRQNRLPVPTPQPLLRLFMVSPPPFDSWVWKIPWRKAWQPTPEFLPAESHGQRSLVGYHPWGRKELDTTEAT